MTVRARQPSLRRRCSRAAPFPPRMVMSVTTRSGSTSLASSSAASTPTALVHLPAAEPEQGGHALARRGRVVDDEGGQHWSIRTWTDDAVNACR